MTDPKLLPLDVLAKFAAYLEGYAQALTDMAKQKEMAK